METQKQSQRQDERMRAAVQRLQEMQDTIAPFVKERKLLFRSTAGQWGTAPVSTKEQSTPKVNNWSGSA